MGIEKVSQVAVKGSDSSHSKILTEERDIKPKRRPTKAKDSHKAELELLRKQNSHLQALVQSQAQEMSRLESKIQRCTCCSTQQVCAGAPTFIQPTSSVQHFGSTAMYQAVKLESVMQPPESVFGFGSAGAQAAALHQEQPREWQWQAANGALNVVVDSYAQRQDGSLLDYAFAQLEGSSSGSFQGSGVGQGHGAPQKASSKLDSEDNTGIMSHNYAKSLKYGVWFEDPELEQKFQEQMTCQRRIAVFASWPALAALMLSGEAAIKHFFPADANRLVLESHQLLCCALLFGFIFVFYCKVLWRDNMSHKSLAVAKFWGELIVCISSFRHLWFILSKFHWKEPEAEDLQDLVIVTLVLCIYSALLPWVEVSPLSMVLISVPMWSALVLVPNVCLIFRLRVCIIGLYMGVMSFMMYRNNRELFVTQVRLQHVHSVTAGLKQEQEFRSCKTNKPIAIDTPDVSHDAKHCLYI